MQHSKITIQVAQYAVCGKVRYLTYFTLTNGDRFYHVFKHFYFSHF